MAAATEEQISGIAKQRTRQLMNDVGRGRLRSGNAARSTVLYVHCQRVLCAIHISRMPASRQTARTRASLTTVLPFRKASWREGGAERRRPVQRRYRNIIPALPLGRSVREGWGACGASNALNTGAAAVRGAALLASLFCGKSTMTCLHWQARWLTISSREDRNAARLLLP